MSFRNVSDRRRSLQRDMLVYSVLRLHEKEGMKLPYTMEDFKREFRQRFLAELTPEERREVLQRVPVEERLEGLSVEEIEDFLRRQREATSSPPQPKRRGGKPQRRSRR